MIRKQLIIITLIVLLMSSISFAIMPPISPTNSDGLRKVKPGQEYMIIKGNAISCKKLNQIKIIFNNNDEDNAINVLQNGFKNGTIKSLKQGDIVKIIKTENHILGGEIVPFYLQVIVNKSKEKVWICAIFIMI